MPFGAVFDMAFGMNPKLPVEIVVNYRGFEEQVQNCMLLDLPKVAELESVSDQYFNTLKEASVIRFGDANNVLAKMKFEDKKKLFDALVKGRFEDFCFKFNQIWVAKEYERRAKIGIRLFVSGKDDFI